MPINRSLYPANWPEISRAAIARAGHVCEECGAPDDAFIVRRPDGSWREPGASEIAGGLEDRRERLTRVVLTTHHRVAVLDGGGHEPANLIALCQMHHLLRDALLHARNAAATRARKGRDRRLSAGQAVLVPDGERS